MSCFDDIAATLADVRELVGDVAHADQLPAAVDALDDDAAVRLISLGSELSRFADQLCAIGAAVVARRSQRDRGTAGVAQTRGHRNAASFLQELTGTTRADAAKHVRVGESLLDTMLAHSASEPEVTVPDIGEDDTRAGEAPLPWHACLTLAQFDGRLSLAQHDAIRRGLGEPPAESGAAEAWAVAAGQLVEEASERTVDELTRSARTIRDQLDPEGARRRFEARHEARSFRTYTDADGVHHGHLVFDDEGFAWVQAIRDSALRPRRGGPRFVDAAEASAAQRLIDDARTNDQLFYDLMLDILRAGALADARQVFGARQAGIRIVHVEGTGRNPVLEDDGSALPDWLIATHGCDIGVTQVSVDGRGDPLDVGREERVFTPRQRVALAVRDGGCRWRGCDRPASYCEAHHIDEWYRDHGRTDIDRGILLCRYHHMILHNGGWRITREGKGDFLLHPPGRADPVVLVPRLARTYLWSADPPAPRFRPAV